MKKRALHLSILRMMIWQLQSWADVLSRQIGDELPAVSPEQAPEEKASGAAVASSIPVSASSSLAVEGPPAHWLARVQRDAPDLLQGRLAPLQPSTAPSQPTLMSQSTAHRLQEAASQQRSLLHRSASGQVLPQARQAEPGHAVTQPSAHTSAQQEDLAYANTDSLPVHPVAIALGSRLPEGQPEGPTQEELATSTPALTTPAAWEVSQEYTALNGVAESIQPISAERAAIPQFLPTKSTAPEAWSTSDFSRQGAMLTRQASMLTEETLAPVPLSWPAAPRSKPLQASFTQSPAQQTRQEGAAKTSLPLPSFPELASSDGEMLQESFPEMPVSAPPQRRQEALLPHMPLTMAEESVSDAGAAQKLFESNITQATFQESLSRRSAPNKTQETGTVSALSARGIGTKGRYDEETELLNASEVFSLPTSRRNPVPSEPDPFVWNGDIPDPLLPQITTDLRPSANTLETRFPGYAGNETWQEIPWPALSDEQTIDSQNWEITRRLWERRQRLDEEQRGNAWSV